MIIVYPHLIGAALYFFVRRPQRHAVLPGQLPHEADRGAIGHALRRCVPPGFLLGAEVGAVEQFLEAEDLHFFLCRLLYEGQVLVHHKLLEPVGPLAGILPHASLDEPGAHYPGRRALLFRPPTSRPWFGRITISGNSQTLALSDDVSLIETLPTCRNPATAGLIAPMYQGVSESLTKDTYGCVPRLMNRPLPEVPTNLPPSTTTFPLERTVSGVPLTTRPSYKL